MLKIIILLMIIFWSPSVMAADFLTVVIDEIAWMGNKESHNNEWIKLFNNSSTSISLDGWKLAAEDGSPEIDLTGKIPKQRSFLLERTDDETVPGVQADLIYVKSLNNNGEHLKLIDEQGELVDEVNCSTGWFSGNNKTKQTMKRKNPTVSGNDPDNWQTTGSFLEIKEVKPLLSYVEGIVINEVLPSPEGSDADNEWIELFNQNDFTVDLSGWKISDIEGTTKVYIFPKETNIKAQSFLLLSRTESKITLNNNGDGLNLIQPNNNIIDSVDWGKTVKNQSYIRTNSVWQWSSLLTPGTANTLPKTTETSSVEKLEPKISSKTFTASLKNSNSSLLIALIIAILSGGTMVFLKRITKRSS